MAKGATSAHGGTATNDGLATSPTALEYFDDADYKWIGSLASGSSDKALYEPFDTEGTAYLSADLAKALLSDDPGAFEDILENDETIHYRLANESFARLVLLGLEYGVACDNGACANRLGAMYYMGDVVEQDYHIAKQLYELAESKGMIRAMLNLGYIYEYGRCGEPNHMRAYMQYAKVAALTGHPEALYKMGDMYSRAKVVERDLRAAWVLYERSLEAMEDVVDKAQPAIRIAKLISDPTCLEWGIPYDPMRALMLFQLAECGLRIDISRGQTYYARRLQEALDGQERMREVLSDPHVFL